MRWRSPGGGSCCAESPLSSSACWRFRLAWADTAHLGELSYGADNASSTARLSPKSLPSPAARNRSPPGGGSWWDLPASRRAWRTLPVAGHHRAGAVCLHPGVGDRAWHLRNSRRDQASKGNRQRNGGWTLWRHVGDLRDHCAGGAGSRCARALFGAIGAYRSHSASCWSASRCGSARHRHARAGSARRTPDQRHRSADAIVSGTAGVGSSARQNPPEHIVFAVRRDAREQWRKTPRCPPEHPPMF